MVKALLNEWLVMNGFMNVRLEIQSKMQCKALKEKILSEKFKRYSI
jgi:hypothetical protein